MSRLYPANGVGGHDHDDFPDTRGHGGAGRHEKGGGIGGGAAGHQQGRPPHGTVAEAQFHGSGLPHCRVAVKDARLEREDIALHPAACLEEPGSLPEAGVTRLGEFRGRHPDGIGREGSPVEMAREAQQRFHALGLDGLADPFHHLLGGEFLPEDLPGELPAALGDNLSLGAQQRAEAQQFPGAIGRGAVDHPRDAGHEVLQKMGGPGRSRPEIQITC